MGVPHRTPILVRDQGIGIPEADQAQLFEAFHRATNVGTVAGSGLGLTIVKHAVDAYGGAVTFDSTPGAGTSFVVSLPTNISARPEPLEKESA